MVGLAIAMLFYEVPHTPKLHKVHRGRAPYRVHFCLAGSEPRVLSVYIPRRPVPVFTTITTPLPFGNEW